MAELTAFVLFPRSWAHFSICRGMSGDMLVVCTFWRLPLPWRPPCITLCCPSPRPHRLSWQRLELAVTGSCLGFLQVPLQALHQTQRGVYLQGSTCLLSLRWQREGERGDH